MTPSFSGIHDYVHILHDYIRNSHALPRNDDWTGSLEYDFNSVGISLSRLQFPILYIQIAQIGPMRAFQLNFPLLQGEYRII